MRTEHSSHSLCWQSTRWFDTPTDAAKFCTEIIDGGGSLDVATTLPQLSVDAAYSSSCFHVTPPTKIVPLSLLYAMANVKRRVYISLIYISEDWDLLRNKLTPYVVPNPSHMAAAPHLRYRERFHHVQTKDRPDQDFVSTLP